MVDLVETRFTHWPIVSSATGCSVKNTEITLLLPPQKKSAFVIPCTAARCAVPGVQQFIEDKDVYSSFKVKQQRYSHHFFSDGVTNVFPH